MGCWLGAKIPGCERPEQEAKLVIGAEGVFGFAISWTIEQPIHPLPSNRCPAYRHQLGESPEVAPAVQAMLVRAARVVDRGIVLESALI